MTAAELAAVEKRVNALHDKAQDRHDMLDRLMQTVDATNNLTEAADQYEKHILDWLTEHPAK